MSKTPVIAIFDIGKTTKKLLLFDERYRIVLEKSHQFEETTDDDGDACEDLAALTRWVRGMLQEVMTDESVDLKALNFSTYGASFVHIDPEGRPVAPLYNYLKPFPDDLLENFYSRYGGGRTFSLQTASPILGNLNSGLQLYSIKHRKPALFDRIRYSLHLPQYMSFLVTGQPCSEITSIGCHTGLWNFPRNHYHEWLDQEGISDKLAAILPSDQLMPSSWRGQPLPVGVGLHDSSAALIPYLSGFTEPFILISTGTWCISLNPFNQTRLTADELQQDCLCYMEYRGKPIKASRLFAGHEHEEQVQRLAAHYRCAADLYKTVRFDSEIVRRLSGDERAMAQTSVFGQRDLSRFGSYEEAYHQLMIDLMTRQAISTGLVLKNSAVKRIFVDGGFAKNPIYMHLLAAAFPSVEVYAAAVAQASAMGAALAVHPSWNRANPPADLIELRRYTAETG